MIVAGTVEAMTVMTTVVVTAGLQGVPLIEDVTILPDAHLMGAVDPEESGLGPSPTLHIKAQTEVMGAVCMQGEVVPPSWFPIYGITMGVQRDLFL